MISFVPWTATGDFDAISAAREMASEMSIDLETSPAVVLLGERAESPTTRLTNPTSLASWPVKGRAERHTSLHQEELPTIFPKRVRVPTSAASPISISFTENVVARVHNRMSAQQAMSIPSPKQCPCRAAIKGFRHVAREEILA